MAKKQVGRLDVAVDDALPVGVIQCPAGLEGHRQHLRRGQGAARGKDAPQAAAPEVLGHQVGLAVDPPVVDRHHVGVGQRSHQAGLSPEAVHECLVAYQRGMQHLDRHLASQREVVGQVDGPRPASPNGVTQAVAAAQHPTHHVPAGRARSPGVRCGDVGGKPGISPERSVGHPLRLPVQTPWIACARDSPERPRHQRPARIRGRDHGPHGPVAYR